MSERGLRGVYAAVVTSIDDVGRISIDRYTRHARWLLRQGCHGLGVFGTTSETAAFTVAERQEALASYVRSGLDPAKMIVGVGCCARGDTVALARHALELGVTRLLCLPPYFYKNNSDEGLYRAFSEVIEGVGDSRLQLLLYHFPQVSGVPVTKPVVERLVAAYPETMAGIKDSSGDLAHTLDLVRSFPTLSIFAGADQHLLDVLKAGGAGTFSAAANLNCAANRQVFDAFEKGDTDSAEKAMDSVAGVRLILQGFPLVPAVKHAIADGQHDPTWRLVRPPLVELDEAQGGALMKALAEAGYAYDPDLYSVASA